MYGKRCDKCGKINHFKVVCRGSQSSVVNAIVKEDIHEQESDIKTVNVNFISFKSNHSMIIAKLKTSSKQATITVPYKFDTGCDGNIMPFNVFKKIFPNTIEDQLVATKDTIILIIYNSTTITQLGRCGVVTENNNKCKKCIFFCSSRRQRHIIRHARY